MSHPFFDASVYPWHRADAKKLHSALYGTVTIFARIDLLYKGIGPGLPPLEVAAPDVVWHMALDHLTAAQSLGKLCKHLLTAAELVSIRSVVLEVISAESVIDQFVLETAVSADLAFVNRKNLRIELNKLASSNPSIRVLLVRGESKSGLTWTRHLVERKAAELGEGPIVYAFDGNVANVNHVLRLLFAALGKPNGVPAKDSTEDAWYMDALFQLQVLADDKKRHLWIVADDLGPGPEGPKLDPAVRKFFEQFALFMANPDFAQWFRLVLIEYPRGSVPTKWKKGFWVEEDTTQSSPETTDIKDYLLEWARKKKKSLPEEQAEKFAAEILSKARAAVRADGMQSLWENLHNELLAVLKTL